MPPDQPAEPWRSFFLDVQRALDQPVDLHCIDGFVISMLYRMPRPTVDVDFVSVAPYLEIAALQAIAGRGSPLHQAHGVCLHYVGVVTVPENYLER